MERVCLHRFRRLRDGDLDPSSRLSSLKRGNFPADTCAVEGNAAEHLFDATDDTHVAADDPEPRSGLISPVRPPTIRSSSTSGRSGTADCSPQRRSASLPA